MRMKAVVLIVAALAIAALSGCASGASSSAASSGTSGASASSAASSASSSAAASSATTSSASLTSSQAAVLGVEDVVTIDLDYNAGTGYEWVCKVEPEGVIAEVENTTTSATSQKDIAGGPLQDHYTFRALKPGEATVTFTLERSWEQGNAAEKQVYAFTVTDDLKMVLNPYKSDFANEPTWGSAS